MREAESMQRAGDHMRCYVLSKILSERQPDSPQVFNFAASHLSDTSQGYLVAGQALGALGRFDGALQFFRHVMLAFPRHSVWQARDLGCIDNCCSSESRTPSRSTRDC